MLLVGAILLAVLVLPPPWGVVAVGGALVVEVAEVWLWFRLLRRIPVRSGAETLIGARAHVVADCRPDGHVRVQGELWRARCEAGASAGEQVRIRALDGLTLVVEREASGEASS